MSSCSRSTSVLSYLMDELSEDDRVLFEKHLNNCPICLRELILERSLQNRLAECPHEDTDRATAMVPFLAGRCHTLFRCSGILRSDENSKRLGSALRKQRIPDRCPRWNIRCCRTNEFPAADDRCSNCNVGNNLGSGFVVTGEVDTGSSLV